MAWCQAGRKRTQGGRAHGWVGRRRETDLNNQSTCLEESEAAGTEDIFVDMRGNPCWALRGAEQHPRPTRHIPGVTATDVTTQTPPCVPWEQEHLRLRTPGPDEHVGASRPADPHRSVLRGRRAGDLCRCSGFGGLPLPGAVLVHRLPAEPQSGAALQLQRVPRGHRRPRPEGHPAPLVREESANFQKRG